MKLKSTGHVAEMERQDMLPEFWWTWKTKKKMKGNIKRILKILHTNFTNCIRWTYGVDVVSIQPFECFNSKTTKQILVKFCTKG
jgi:hypothetical protein